MDSLLTAYNAANPASDPVLARGDANPIWPVIQSMVIFGVNFTFPTSRGADALCVSSDIPWELMDELVGSLANLATLFDRILAMGGEIDQYPLFLQLPAAMLNVNMPAAIPNRSYFDDSDPPVEVIRKVGEYWSTSETFSEYPRSFDGDATYWAPAQDPWNGGKYWPISLLFSLPREYLRTTEQYTAASEA